MLISGCALSTYGSPSARDGDGRPRVVQDADSVLLNLIGKKGLNESCGLVGLAVVALSVNGMVW